eukprot:4613119-Pleurochrysis_carterae.AAC.2
MLMLLRVDCYVVRFQVSGISKGTIGAHCRYVLDPSDVVAVVAGRGGGRGGGDRRDAAAAHPRVQLPREACAHHRWLKRDRPRYRRRDAPQRRQVGFGHHGTYSRFEDALQTVHGTRDVLTEIYCRVSMVQEQCSQRSGAWRV